MREPRPRPVPVALTVHAICERYGVGEHTVLAWIRSGELRAVNVGRKPGTRKPRWRVTQGALDAFEALRTVTSPAPRPPQRKRQRPSDVISFY
jgi:excisionase family DNA binding protein